jgi:hypothetical protein
MWQHANTSLVQRKIPNAECLKPARMLVPRAPDIARHNGRTVRGTTPFGNLAIPPFQVGPMALRPTLTDGLPLSWITLATLSNSEFSL